MPTAIEIGCIVIESIIIFVDLTVHKWYSYYFSSRNNFEITKWIAGIISSAVSFMITTLTAIFSIISTNGERTIGWVQLITCALISVIHFVIEFNAFYKNELNKQYFKSYNGVFAVSAIILTADKQKVLLATRKHSDNNWWTQPGVYYRTNVLHKNPPNLLPFDEFIAAKIEEECGLTTGQYKLVPLNSLITAKKNTFEGAALTQQAARYHKNKLAPTPFLIQIEEAEPEKRSRTKRHIDCFYAFELTISDDQSILDTIRNHSSSNARYEKIDTFTLDEVRSMCDSEHGLHRNNVINHCYPDLAIILEKFYELWRQEIFASSYSRNIRYCSFNTNKHTIWIRLNKNCNLACDFCLMVNRENTVLSKVVKQSSFREFWDSLTIFNDTTDYHLIITGGEPFLVKNLYNMIMYMDQHSNGKISSISICTNGTLGIRAAQRGIHYYAKNNLDNILSDCCSFKNKVKFVINMSSYDKDSFIEITQGTSEQYSQQCDFIHRLHNCGITHITANVVMTSVLQQHLSDYFDTWRKLHITDVAFSYAIQQGIDCRNKPNRIRTLSKKECISLYGSIGQGKYPIEYFDNFELVIPSCDEKNCKENTQIYSCFQVSDNNWTLKHGCIDN